MQLSRIDLHPWIHPMVRLERFWILLEIETRPEVISCEEFSPRMNGKEGERQEIALPEGPGGIRNDHVSSKWRVLGAEDMVPVFLRQRGTGPLAQGSFTQTKTLLSSGTANSEGPFNNEGTTSQHHKSAHMYLFKLSSRGGGKVGRSSRGPSHMSAPP